MGFPSLLENGVDRANDALASQGKALFIDLGSWRVPHGKVKELEQERRRLLRAQLNVNRLERRLGVVPADVLRETEALRQLREANEALRRERDQARAENRMLLARIHALAAPSLRPSTPAKRPPSQRPPSQRPPSQPKRPSSPRRGAGYFIRTRAPR